MPYINIRITKENGKPTKQQKEELMAGVCELFEKVMGRSAKNAVVIIDKIEPENYAIAGKSINAIRADK